MKKSKSGILRNVSILALVSIIIMVFSACPDGEGGDDPVTFKVTFDANGGTPATTTQNVASGDKVTPPSAPPTRPGYTFTDWYKEAAGTNKWIFTTDTVTADITLYAGWTEQTFTVTFNSGVGGSAVPAQNIASGGKVTEPKDVTKSGQDLEGWYKEAAFTTKWNFATDTVTADITLYARWGYSVTFNSNGGTTVPKQIKFTGDKVTEPQPPKKGYPFLGWFKDTTLTDDKKWNFTTDTVASASIALYAKWGEYGNDKYALGATGPGGGKIFYVSDDGFEIDENTTAHYLEAAPSNMETALAWASTSKTSTNIANTETDIGKGKKNTALILTATTGDPAAPAALACKNYTEGSQTDWFLPSKDELSKLYENKDTSKANISNLGASTYWSSSQGESSSEAYRQAFTGSTASTSPKNEEKQVRAIRAF